MSNVLIEKDKLDVLATAIANKSGEPLKLTLAEMVSAVDGIPTGDDLPKAGTLSAYFYGNIEDPNLWSLNGRYITFNVNETRQGGYVTAESSGWVDEGSVDDSEITLELRGEYQLPNGTEGSPTATKGTVSNHQVSVTPSVTNTAGYISGGTKTGTAVTVSASELVSGNLPITQNGNNIDCANYSTVSVNVPSGSSKNTQVVQSTTRTSASTLTAIGAELTVSKTGTYDIYYSCFRTNTSSSYTWATRLYINGTAYGTAENTTWTNNQQNTHLSNISLTVGDKLRVYGRNTRGTSYYICAPTLAIVEA